MSLIKCKACSKDFSDTISACIHCGHPREQKAGPISSKEVETVASGHTSQPDDYSVGSVFSVSKTGSLQFRINEQDSKLGNNSGELDLTILVQE